MQFHGAKEVKSLDLKISVVSENSIQNSQIWAERDTKKAKREGKRKKEKEMRKKERKRSKFHSMKKKTGQIFFSKKNKSIEKKDS